MKMLSKIATCLLVLFFSLSAFTQSISGKNMGKVNLSAFVLKGFNLQYERQVSKRVTVALGYGSIPYSAIAFESLIQDKINDPEVKVSDFKLGTSVFTPEIRFYVGRKGAFRGFYLAPYTRIGRYKLQGPVEYTTDANGKRNVLFNGKVTTFSGGLLMGSSFRLSGKLYLDWWILGAGIGGSSGTFAAKTQLSPDEQVSLRSALDNLDIPLTKTMSGTNSNGATVTTSGTMAGVRGLGINLGIRF